MWVMAQIKRIASHAFLILDIIPLADVFELIQSSVTEYCRNIFSFESKDIPIGDIELSH